MHVVIQKSFTNRILVRNRLSNSDIEKKFQKLLSSSHNEQYENIQIVKNNPCISDK